MKLQDVLFSIIQICQYVQCSRTWYPRQPRRLPPETFLSRLFRGSGSREPSSFSENCRGYPKRCTLRCPSHEWIRGHVFTHRCRLPELEGSVISVLGRIASLVCNCCRNRPS